MPPWDRSCGYRRSAEDRHAPQGRHRRGRVPPVSAPGTCPSSPTMLSSSPQAAAGDSAAGPVPTLLPTSASGTRRTCHCHLRPSSRLGSAGTDQADSARQSCGADETVPGEVSDVEAGPGTCAVRARYISASARTSSALARSFSASAWPRAWMSRANAVRVAPIRVPRAPPIPMMDPTTAVVSPGMRCPWCDQLSRRSCTLSSATVRKTATQLKIKPAAILRL